MFTWEEAGLLRQMLLVLFWIVVCLALATGVLWLRRPPRDAVRSAPQRVDSAALPHSP